MNSGKRIALAVLLCVLAATGWAAVQTMSVQVKNGQLRASPSFIGKIVSAVAYGDQVTVQQKQGDWYQVSAGTASGWIHLSALTTKKVVLQSGTGDARTAASGEELALAGKGFNSDVEADFKAKNKDVDFRWIDRMETYKVSPEEVTRFLQEGGVGR